MKRFAIVAAIWACFAAPVMAFEIGAMTPEERQIFRDEVRAYLLENPEVLVEAIGVLEQRQAAQASISEADLIAANATALFGDGFSYEGGNPDGDVVLVEFLDYRCPFCKRAHPEVAELIRTDGNIKYIIKEFPILGEQSILASRFAISVLQNSDPASYSTVTDTLMAMRGEISLPALERIAGDMKLDVDKIMNGMADESISRIIAANYALAQNMQITGTPGFVIGDQMLRGFVPRADMQKVVDEVRLTLQ